VAAYGVGSCGVMLEAAAAADKLFVRVDGHRQQLLGSPAASCTAALMSIAV